MIPEKDLTLFLENLPRRKRVPDTDIWQAIKKAFPGQGSLVDWNVRLPQMLDILVEKNTISLPRSKKLRLGRTVPAWVERNDIEKRVVERVHGHIWAPELSFLAGQPPESDSHWLLLDRWLKGGGRDAEMVPIRERSLEIFNDEKRFDKIITSRPFTAGLVSPSTFRCYYVAAPIALNHGPIGSEKYPGIVVENVNTWHSLCEYNKQTKRYAYVAYGCGNAFLATQEGAAEVAKSYGHESISYFGDVDLKGLEIFVGARRRLAENGINLKLDLWLYQLLFQISSSYAPVSGRWSKQLPQEIREALPDPLLSMVESLFTAKHRLPQEMVGMSILMKNPS